MQHKLTKYECCSTKITKKRIIFRCCINMFILIRCTHLQRLKWGIYQLIKYCPLHLIKFIVIIDIETLIPTATDFNTWKPVRERTHHYYKFLAVIELTVLISLLQLVLHVEFCRSIQSILNSLLLMLLMGLQREVRGTWEFLEESSLGAARES